MHFFFSFSYLWTLQKNCSDSPDCSRPCNWPLPRFPGCFAFVEGRPGLPTRGLERDARRSGGLISVIHPLTPRCCRQFTRGNHHQAPERERRQGLWSAKRQRFAKQERVFARGTRHTRRRRRGKFLQDPEAFLFMRERDWLLPSNKITKYLNNCSSRCWKRFELFFWLMYVIDYLVYPRKQATRKRTKLMLSFQRRVGQLPLPLTGPEDGVVWESAVSSVQTNRLFQNITVINTNS